VTETDLYISTRPSVLSVVEESGRTVKLYSSAP
jgi:hypothetical protein